MPPTLQALVAARLDRLGGDERTLLEHASVVGRVFERGSIGALAPERLAGSLDSRLAGLVRKQLIEPWPAALPGDEGYRFRHILIRDAAYRRLTKKARAQLHEQFARWLDARPGDHGEIVGYHLEQACLYLAELGEPADRRAPLADEASARLECAGQSALGRGDLSAAVNLFERAAALSLESECELRLDLEVCRALVRMGEFARAREKIDAAVAAAERLGSTGLEVQARLEQIALRGWIEPEGGSEALRREAEAALPVLERLGDDLALAHVWRHISEVHLTTGRFAACAEALEQAVRHARAAGSRGEELALLARLPASTYCGPTPVREAIRRCERIREEAGDNVEVRTIVVRYLGALHSMTGAFEEGRRLLESAEAMGQELGSVRMAAGALVCGELELLAGAPEEAERVLRPAYDLFAARDERGVRPSLAALLACALHEQGRDAEAERLAIEAAEVAASDDVHAQALGRGVRARVVARRGAHAEAEALAREAVAIAETTDFLNLRGDLLVGLAEVLSACGRADEAAAVLDAAVALYERKGNAVSAAYARRLLDASPRHGARAASPPP